MLQTKAAEPMKSRYGFRSIRLLILALSLLSSAFLLVFVAFAWHLAIDTKHTFEFTDHSSYVLERARLLETDFDNVQNAERMYVLLGTPATRSAFVVKAGTVTTSAASLPSVVKDNPSQEALAVQIDRHAIGDTNAMLAFVALMHAGGRQAIYDRQQINAMAATPASGSRSGSFRTDLARFIDAEAKLQSEREAAAGGLWIESALFFAASALAVIVITLLLNLTLGLRIVSRLQLLAEQASSFASSHHILAPVRGRDEISEVSKTIHDMAVQIKERTDVLVRYRLLAEQTLDSIMFFRNPDGRIVEANRAAVNAYGYSMEELLTMTGFDLLSSAQLRHYQDIQYGDILNTTVETEHRRKDGSVFPVLVSMQTALLNDEQIVMVVIRDLTERDAAMKSVRAAADQAMEASRLKSEFVATMSHEIRTPMNGVVGMTELLLDTSLTREQRDFATTAMESAHSLLGVIDNILDFSKIEAGRVDLEVIEFDLLHKIESLGALFSAQAHAKEISFVTFVDPKLAHRLLGDPTRLRQVLTNLVANAIKFTSKGCVALSADVLSFTERITRIRFSVRDTGIGIAAEKVPTLFEAFRQADGSTTREYGGTGLGLSISSNLVRLMGGQIKVETAPGKGSTFSFVLDFPAGSAVPAHPARLDLAELHALVVDDDAMSRDILSRYAVSWGIHVGTAETATEALSFLRRAADDEHPYDVAIIDLRMPDMDGMQLAATIRLDPQLARTRLVLVTAYDGPAQGQAAIRAGFSAYLTKPVRQAQLYDCITGALLGLVDELAPETPAEPVAERRDHILLAEDNAINRQVALQQLRRLGYAADSVTNGQEAVEQTRKVDYDLILMDCHMPVMDGFEATKIIRSRESRTGRHVAIVAMTANALARDRELCLTAGMDEHLTKPVGLEDMRMVTDRWLGSPDENTIIDRERIEDIFGDDRTAMSEFLAGVIPGIGVLCDKTAQSTDLPALRELAHELKGAAGNIGARELATAAVALESQLGRATDCNELQIPLLEIAHAWTRLNHLAGRPNAFFGRTR
jgi:PAS domain S-box-containing protein